jgi:hypothetical protein
LDAGARGLPFFNGERGPPPPEGPDSPAAQPAPRIMHGPDAAPFHALRAKM